MLVLEVSGVVSVELEVSGVPRVEPASGSGAVSSVVFCILGLSALEPARDDVSAVVFLFVDVRSAAGGLLLPALWTDDGASRTAGSCVDNSST